MPIDIRCECGRCYRVADEVAGKLIRCKECGDAVRVPDMLAEETNPVPRKAPPLPPSSGARRPPRETDDADGGRSDDRRAVSSGRSSDSPATDRRMQREYEKLQEGADTAASNPGLLRMSYLRWLMAFPRWPLIWTGSWLVVSLLILVHPLFILPSALLFLIVCFYWYIIRRQFIVGCINPGRIISVHPPLVAVSTDLTKGGTDCDVIKILRQPLSRMSSGPPRKGQFVAAIAVYGDVSEASIGLDHWTDFSPVVVDLVSGNQRDIDRVVESLNDQNWQELKLGLGQIPDSPEPGIYRVWPPDHQSNPVDEDSMFLITEQLLQGLGGKSCHNHAEVIPREIRDVALKAYGKGTQPQQVLAVAESTSASDKGRTGMLIATNGVHFSFPECGTGRILWHQLHGALATEETLELSRADGKRVRILKKHFRTEVMFRLEQTINGILGLLPESP